MIRIILVTAAMLAFVSTTQAQECFIASAPTMERIPDSYGAVVDNNKGRMIPIIVTSQGRPSAIQVEFVSLPIPYDLWNGTKMFAKAPVDICEIGTITTGSCPKSFETYVAAKLECTDTPYFADWNAQGVVNVWHEGIVPGATYNVRVLDATCNPDIPENYSAKREVQTADFGDTVGVGGFAYPVDYYVGIADALGGIAAFTNTPGKPSKSRTDLKGKCIDFSAGINDVLDSLRAFTGLPYAESPSSPNACDAVCENSDYP